MLRASGGITRIDLDKNLNRYTQIILTADD
jgi:hypothetical protein